MLPRISFYGESERPNPSMIMLEIGNLVLFYSYRSIVAYKDLHEGLIVSENIWGATTGKHLNQIDGGDKESRLPREEFLKAVNAAIRRNEHTLLGL